MSVSVSRLGARRVLPPARPRQSRWRGARLLYGHRNGQRLNIRFRTRSGLRNERNTMVIWHLYPLYKVGGVE